VQNKNNINKYKFKEIIKNKLRDVQLLCIDEFHVLDISDVMIILEFFKIISNFHFMIVVINSNRSPEELYKNGIHRDRFAPVLDLINKNSHIIELNTKDYRLDVEKELINFINFNSKNFYNINNHKEFNRLFENKAKNLNAKIENKKYNLLKLEIELECIKKNDLVCIKIDFLSFFSKALYAKDYKDFFEALEIKKVYINNLINLDHHNDIIIRFIAFTDIAYEMNIYFIIGSNVSIYNIYVNGSLIFEFERIISRLNVICRDKN
jgi:cell division protein ZapE